MNNFPCKCGHNKKIHFNWPADFWECNKRKLCRTATCNCYGYKADNLKYLEQIYDQRMKQNV